MRRDRIALLGLPDRQHSKDVIDQIVADGSAVVTVDKSRHPVYASSVEMAFTVGAMTFGEVMAVLEPLHRRHPLTGIARFHEMTVELTNRVAVALDLPHFDETSIIGCVNKLQMRRWMAEREIAHPAFTEVRSLREAEAAAETLGFPLVVKPQVGGASHGVTRVNGVADLSRFFAHIDVFWQPDRFVIEEYLPGPEFSVETVTEDAPVHVAIFEKPEPLDGPYFLEEVFITPPRLDERGRSAVLGAATDLVVGLGLSRCVTHTEIRLTQQGPRVLEFALRPIGYPGPLCVQRATGVDLLAAMVDIASGRRPATSVLPAAVAPPGLDGFAGWRYVTVSDAGQLVRVDGVELARCVPGVIDVDVWARPGERLSVPPNGFNYIKGYVTAIGSSFGSVEHALDTSAKSIELVVDRRHEGDAVRPTQSDDLT